MVDRLREHAGQGRLDIDELETRLGAAFAARTRADLGSLLADLPETRQRPAPRAPLAVLESLGYLPLVVAILLLALAPPSICWIGWPLLGWWLFAGMTPWRRPQRSIVA